MVEVDEGDDAGFTAWTEVEDFYGVDARAKVYVLDRADGEIRFGSEQALIGGRIPAANRLLARANIRATLSLRRRSAWKSPRRPDLRADECAGGTRCRRGQQSGGVGRRCG